MGLRYIGISIIIIITSSFSEDNILNTYKHLSDIWSSFKTNYTVIHKTHIKQFVFKGCNLHKQFV